MRVDNQRRPDRWAIRRERHLDRSGRQEHGHSSRWASASSTQPRIAEVVKRVFRITTYRITSEKDTG